MLSRKIVHIVCLSHGKCTENGMKERNSERRVNERKKKGWKCGGILVKKGQIPVTHYNNCTWRAQGTSDLMGGEVKERLKVL